MRAALAAALAVLAVGLALAAAGAGPAGGAARGGVLRLGTGENFKIDPALAYNIFTAEIEYATCATLFTYPDRPGAAGTAVVAEVARRTTVSNGGRTYTFDLRRGFRFHTGAPVNAASFAEAFNRDADPKLNSSATFYMHEIAGADAVIAGKTATISGVRVLGAYRLQIRLTRPLADFTARLTMPFFCPLPPGTPHHEVDEAPGSGPYYVAEHVANRRTVLRRNRYYGGERPANVDEVVWRHDLAETECAGAIERDEVDTCLLSPSSNLYRELADRYGINLPGGRFFVAPNLATWYLAFNHDRPAFKGPGQIPLAKAINYALDRHELARVRGYLAVRRTDRILPPALGRAEHDYPLAGADPVTARAWLAKAKLKPEKLVFYALNGVEGVHSANVLAYDLRQLGIELEVKYFSSTELFHRAGTRGEPFDIVMVGWAADYADPVTFFRPLLHGESLRAAGNGNLSYLDDPKVNSAIDAADRLTGAARRKAWADLDASLMRENPPWAPYFHPTRRVFISASLGCFFVHPVNGLDIAAVCKK